MYKLVETVGAWQRGDPAAGEQIIQDEYIHNTIEARVNMYPSKYHDDLRQEAYCHMLRRLRYRMKLNGVSPEHNFARIINYVKNCARYDIYQYYLRKIKYATAPKSNQGKLIPIIVQSYDDEMYMKQALDNLDKMEIRDAVDNLPHPIHRQIIIGHYFEDRSLVELAQTLNLKRSNISRYHRDALASLGARLEDYDDLP